jgi:hypothetical protein
MTTKCNCNNCSAHIEFEEEHAGETAACPKCGLETVLYIPQKGLPTRRFPKLPSTNSGHDYAAHLVKVRSTSCYKTLRIVINVTFLAIKVIAGLCAVASAVSATLLRTPRLGTPFAANLGLAAISVIVALVFIALVHAVHQAALLLIDITDCSIRTALASEHPPVPVPEFQT